MAWFCSWIRDGVMSVKDIIQAAAGVGGVEPVDVSWDLAYGYYDPPESSKWNFSTARTSRTLLVETQDTAPQAIFFKPDGTKVYFIGSAKDILYEYNINRWYPTALVSLVSTINLATYELTITGIFFKPDGTKFYIVGSAGDRVKGFNLTTPWAIATLSFAEQTDSLAARSNLIQDVFFKPDGTKMYTIDFTTRNVDQYDLTTPWDVTTIVYSQSFSVNSQETSPRALSFKTDGTKMYALGTAGDDINIYNLSTPWDVATASYQSSYSIAAQFVGPTAIYFRPDGGGFIVYGDAINGTLTNAYIKTWVFGQQSILAQDTNATGLCFSADGTRMYFIGQADDAVEQFSLSTPWDISTLSHDGVITVTPQTTGPFNVVFSFDGINMYVSGTDNNGVFQYTLSTPWEISSATYVRSFIVTSYVTGLTGTHFSPDGTNMFCVGSINDILARFILSTPWDISTASYESQISVLSQDTNVRDLSFKPDGTRMYLLGDSSGKIHQYDLSTPWDITSAALSFSFDTESETWGSTYGMFFRDDGQKFFLVNASFDAVTSYAIGIQG